VSTEGFIELTPEEAKLDVPPNKLHDYLTLGEKGRSSVIDRVDVDGTL
jgi:hypothetical protein